MSRKAQYDLVVVGAGPAGYVAAIRAAQLGLSAAVVEKEAALGGTCLRVGCIPSKALLESSERYASALRDLAAHGVRVKGVELDLEAMMRRKESIVAGLARGVGSLVRQAGTARYRGRARIAGKGLVRVDEEGVEIEGRHVLIATGSRPAPLEGVALDGDRVGTSTEALAWTEVPERLVVIGAGFIGLELGSVWARLGSRVTVIDVLDRILPGMDSEIAEAAREAFEAQGLAFRLATRVVSARAEGRGCRVVLEDGEELDCDRVLLAAGRVAASDDLGLEKVGILRDRRGRIRIDDAFRTTAERFLAAGDVVRGPMLAHKASAEAVACVETLVDKRPRVNHDAIPAVVYTNPEIAAVGKTEDDLEPGTYCRGVFPFRANGRARCLGEDEGFVKVLADVATDRLLGVHVLGPRAGDLIAEAAAAIEFSASAEDLALTTHAHPSLAEALQEAALTAIGRARHQAPKARRG